ncbi:MAG: peptide chain release factor 1 [Parachlamydiales bacterium]|jgi:peptide chain release factor 1
MQAKVEKLLFRLSELERQLSDPLTVSNLPLYKALTREHAYLNQIKETSVHLQRIEKELLQNQTLLLSEKEGELLALVKSEIASLEKEKLFLLKKLESLLVPPDPRDDRGVLLEIRAGTGGEEAALFVADCVRMYRGFADRKGWKIEILSASASDLGGYKEYIMGISGTGVFRFLQYEAGTHRVQRVPTTEASGRLHTSAITVALLLEPDESEQSPIDERDLTIETFRASGAGGQHVNTTDSAVRIIHNPSGLVVTCQDERSQHKNKAKAIRLLAARLIQQKEEEQHKAMSALRSEQIGSGDRSERIRTYNFPQNRVTDHRIDLTLYRLDQVMQGDLEELASALVSFYYQKKLSS